MPTTKVEEGILAKLPRPSWPMPREKPVPLPKAPTKWEEFAKRKVWGWGDG